MLSDWEIKKLAEQGMIDPFVDRQVRSGNISYGLSSVGYDMRLAREFKQIINRSDTLIDPKSVNSAVWATFEDDESIDIMPGTFVLGRSVERWQLPPNVAATVYGKSTYARCGLVVNVTPMEPGWSGYLTIEISNTGAIPARVYVNEGIAQAVFFWVSPQVTYADRGGKYHNQPAAPVKAIL